MVGIGVVKDPELCHLLATSAIKQLYFFNTRIAFFKGVVREM